MKHCLPPKSGASPRDIGQINRTCVNIQIALYISNRFVIVHQLALNIIEFEIKHGPSNLVNTCKLVLVGNVMAILQ